MRRGATALLVAIAALGPGEALRAQSSVSGYFGENADAATGVATGQTLALAFTRLTGLSGVAAGLGLPTEPSTGTGWLSGSAWTDVPDVFGEIGLMGEADGFGYRDPLLDTFGAGLTATVQAYHEAPAGPGRVRLRGGARAGILGASAATTLRRALAGAGSDFTVPLGPLLLRVSGDVWAGDDVYPELAATGVLSRGRLLAHARVSRWLHDALSETGWSVGAEVRVADRIALAAGVARQAPDVLFRTPVRRSWSVGLRYLTGDRGAGLSTPAVVDAGEGVRLSVRAADDGGPVRVAGTFNGWTPAAMRRQGDLWVVDLVLEPGVYEFAFVAPDGSWFVPEETPGRKPDGFGGHIGTLVVR